MTGESVADFNLLDGIAENFNAKKKFKQAIDAVQALNRIKGAGNKSSSEEENIEDEDNEDKADENPVRLQA